MQRWELHSSPLSCSTGTSGWMLGRETQQIVLHRVVGDAIEIVTGVPEKGRYFFSVTYYLQLNQLRCKK